jgi:hypothetical protein
MGGMQRKLFLDDYTYAKVLSGADRSEGESVYHKLLEQVRKLDENCLKEGL